MLPTKDIIQELCDIQGTVVLMNETVLIVYEIDIHENATCYKYVFEQGNNNDIYGLGPYTRVTLPSEMIYTDMVVCYPNADLFEDTKNILYDFAGNLSIHVPQKHLQLKKGISNLMICMYKLQILLTHNSGSFNEYMYRHIRGRRNAIS